MTEDEIIDLATEAGLAYNHDDYPDIWDTYMNVGREEIMAFAKLVAAKAIAELESQEPVGRFAKFTDGIWREVTDGSAGVPLYTHPPKRTWVGLTDDEINEWTPEIHGVIQAIEAKLKEKNGYAEEKNT